MTQPFFTIGHSTRSLDVFVGLVRRAGVELVVDIRRVTRSRTIPQFNEDALAASGPLYEHVTALGGRASRCQSWAHGRPNLTECWRRMRGAPAGSG